MVSKKCDCGYVQEIRKDNRKQNKTYRCGGCGTTNSLKALLLIAIFALGSLGTVYADTLNLQYDSENLNYTATNRSNLTASDGSFWDFVDVRFAYKYVNGTEVNPRPVIADPLGTFAELMLQDGANVLKAIAEPIADIVEEIAQVITNATNGEPEVVYPHEQQLLIDNVHLYCDQLSVKLNAIGLAFDFEYQSDEYYATHEKEAKMDAADCKARLELGNNVLGDQYLTHAEQAELDALEFNQTTTTDTSKKSNADYSVDGDMWTKQAEHWYNWAKTTGVTDYGYGHTFDEQYQGDKVISTDDNSPTVEEEAKQKLEQQKLADDNAWKKLCSDAWEISGEGSIGIRHWDTHLLNGDCVGYIIDHVDEEGIVHYIDIEQERLDRIQFELDELERLQGDRVADAEAIKQRNIERAQEEYERLTTIPKTNSTNGTGN